MNKSKFEEFNIKILKKIIEILYKMLNEEGYSNPYAFNLTEDDIWDIIYNCCKVMGIGSPEEIDIDFIFSLYKLNYSKINDEGKITESLSTPKIAKYSFEVDVHEIVSQRQTYLHKVYSYSEDNVIPTSMYRNREGWISVWDGELIDTDIYDTETNDINWDFTSLREIK